MITVTKFTNARTGSETFFYRIESYPFVVKGRPCIAVDDYLREQLNHDLNDFDGTLEVLGFEEVSHDPYQQRSYWAKRA